MANPEHLAILKQGVEAWNEWREEHSEVTPDFGEADLRGADLSNARLSGDVLWNPTPQSVGLKGGGLRFANPGNLGLGFPNRGWAARRRAGPGWSLGWPGTGGDGYKIAHFWIADLSGADFHGADLFRANLTGANLTETDLRGAELAVANLRRTNFSGACLMGASLQWADL